jgi:hypothetical protein
LRTAPGHTEEIEEEEACEYTSLHEYTSMYIQTEQ